MLDVDEPENLSATDLIKNLLDFFLKDMLHRADSALIRRIDRLLLQ